MKIHTLKIKPHHLDAILKGKKTCEIRKNDREYEVGDLLEFNAYQFGEYVKRKICLMEITHIDTFAQKPDYVVLSIKIK